MSAFDTTFGILVALPAIALAGIAAMGKETSTYARRALVAYAALLSVALATLFASAIGNPVVVYIALAFGYFSLVSEGPFALGLSAFGLFVLLIVGITQPVQMPLAGTALGLAAALIGLVLEIRRTGLRRRQ